MTSIELVEKEIKKKEIKKWVWCELQPFVDIKMRLAYFADMYGKFPRASPTKSLGIRGWTVLARSSREPRALTGKFSWVQGLRGGWRLVMTRRVVAAGALRPQEASPSSHFHSILR